MITASCSLDNIPRGALAWWLLRQDLPQKTIVVVTDDEVAQTLVDELKGLPLVPKQWAPHHKYSVMSYLVEDEASRQVALYEWLHQKLDILVCSQEALTFSCDDAQTLFARTPLLKPGFTLSRSKFEELLLLGGFSRAERCEQIGEYTIRGDVIDLWPASSETGPIRILWNIDTIEALRTIDAHTQRSGEYLRELRLHPVTAGLSHRLEDVLPPHVVCYRWRLSKEASSAVVDGDGAGSDVPENRRYSFDPEAESHFLPPPSFVGHLELLRSQLKAWNHDDWHVGIFCHNQGECDRLEELLVEPLTTVQGQKPPWIPSFFIADVEHGFVDSLYRVVILTNAEIFGRYRKRARLPRFEAGSAVKSPLDILPGDFLVHEKHGIGRYVGLKTLSVARVTSEFLMIEYKGGDKLYVPIFELQQVQKYLGAEGKRPALSSLDSPAWERTKSKVKEEVARLAAELLKNAAQRTLRPGYSFPPSGHLEQEFAKSFMYKLTPDQEKTLEEVERDMQSSKAMDRLICGDVGYGKTEIAMRAALKAALAGKQVAVLCPTTILAEQHHRNFSERLADYPVTVNLLSRFQEKAAQKMIIGHLRSGGVDIIIGTHRLLSSDIEFKNLGLLIIDEEHRFGVKQKNQLLGLRETVDVLSLTATPIPRTLASSLGGLKDLSLIETAPEGRIPISTHVGMFDEELMIQAVQRELDRGGQVFYVHNRVKTLMARKTYLEQVLPQVRIVMAHGQFSGAELEKAMVDFLHKKVDVLLATTIIESGLDIPSVNTLIVEEVEEMGLAQLYQLRGRVGRSSKKAYCYLFYSLHNITSEAKKRLQALKDYSALGSGFRLAMRDMEIRGAGNLLGPQQHGNMAAVGIETYSRLLNEEIQKQKGQAIDDIETPLSGPVLELELSAYLPEDYLPSESERVMTYKRLLSADAAQLAKLKEELIDRCGPLLEPVKLLFDTAALRLRLRLCGVCEVHQHDTDLLIYFSSNFKIPDASFQRLLAQADDVLTLIPGPTTGVRFMLKETEQVLDGLGRFIRLIFPIT